jgi:hypothetical protein
MGLWIPFCYWHYGYLIGIDIGLFQKEKLVMSQVIFSQNTYFYLVYNAM